MRTDLDEIGLLRETPNLTEDDKLINQQLKGTGVILGDYAASIEDCFPMAGPRPPEPRLYEPKRTYLCYRERLISG